MDLYLGTSCAGVARAGIYNNLWSLIEGSCVMSVWSRFKQICTPYAFFRDGTHQDTNILAGAMIGGVVGGTSKGLAVGVASAADEEIEQQSADVDSLQGDLAPNTDNPRQ